MAMPEELADLERQEKALNERLIVLRIRVKDVVVARNRLDAEIMAAESEATESRDRYKEERTADVVDMLAFEIARDEMWDAEDLVTEKKNEHTKREAELKGANDEIATVEEILAQVRAQRAKWGEVIPFRPRPARDPGVVE